MCRLLCANKEGINMLEESLGLKKMLDHLEKQCGGHGIGILLIKDSKITFYKKGVEYTNKQVAKRVLNSDFDYFMYHTRIASVSGITDENCHPYVTKKRDLALMMNGTEREIGYLASPLGITDTEMVFRMIRDYNVPIKALESLSARYMGIKDGKVFIVNSQWGGLEFIREKNAFVVASSFPHFIKSKSLKTGLWVQGQKIEEKTYSYTRPVSYAVPQHYQDRVVNRTAGGTLMITRDEKKQAIEEIRNGWCIEDDISEDSIYDGFGGYR